MKLRINQLLLLTVLALTTIMYSSCGKENFDDTSTEEEEFPVDSIDCMLNYDLTLGLLGGPIESVSVTTITGGLEPFSYLWSTGDTLDFTLAPTIGNYSVTVTDSNNCTLENSIFVDLNTSPCDTNYLVIIEQKDTLIGKALTAIPDSGTSPYSFEWSTGEIGSQIVVISPGDYSVTITDANGCTTDASTSVVMIDSCFGFMVEIQDSLIGFDSIQLDAVLSAGQSPYAYEWSTGATTNFIQTLNDSTVSFSVTVTDAIGCTASDIF